MDGCSSHFSDYFLDEASYHGVYPWQEPAGTSDQIQALDLGIFGIQKKQSIRRRLKGSKLNPTSIEIINIFDTWRTSTVPQNVVSAFNQAGIFVAISDEKTIVCADVSKARAVRGIDHTECENVLSGRTSQKLPIF